jgi:hypothetical protein
VGQKYGGPSAVSRMRLRDSGRGTEDESRWGFDLADYYSPPPNRQTTSVGDPGFGNDRKISKGKKNCKSKSNRKNQSRDPSLRSG